MNQEKNSFLLYTEQYELVEQLSNEQAGMLFKALYEYVSSGEMSELDALSKLVFTSIRQDLDRNAEKYEEIVEKRRIAGSIGGRKRAEKYSKNLEQENLSDDEFVANAKFATSNCSKSAYYDNENDNENDNVNENVNDNLSLLSEREERDYKGEEREKNLFSKNTIPLNPFVSTNEKRLLISHVKNKMPEVKNPEAYVHKIIQNGDYEILLEKIREAPKKKTREERIKEELSSIHDKKSALKVLAEYYNKGTPPDEFNEIMLKYDLDTFDKAEAYSRELAQLKSMEGIPPSAPPPAEFIEARKKAEKEAKERAKIKAEKEAILSAKIEAEKEAREQAEREELEKSIKETKEKN